MAGCYDRDRRVGSGSRGTRSQFRVNSQRLSPFKCTHPIYLTEVMETGESSQAAQFNASGQFSTIRTGRTVREYDQEIEELRKENFDLKLRLYLLEVRTSKGGGDNNQNGPLEVDVQLTYEAESLRNEIVNKNKLLQDALSQAEKYGVDLEVALKENSQLQAKIDSIIKDTDLRLQQLTDENDALKETARKSTVAIQGFVMKFKEEYNLLPSELRTIVVNAVNAAKESNRENVVSLVNSLKDYLCQIMRKPYGDVFEPKRSFSTTSEQIQCLEQELYKQKMCCKDLEKKVSGIINEPQKPSLESVTSEKDSASVNHKESLEQPKDDVLHDLQQQLILKNDALSSLKKLVTLSYGEESNKDLSTSPLFRDQSEYLEAIDSAISDNREICDADETVKQIFEQVASIMRSNSGLLVEVNDQLVEINTLTASCSDLEQKIMKLQSELSAAKKKVQHLDKESKGKRDKLSIILSRCNASTQSDVATVEESAQTILDHYLSDFSSSNVNDLKEEICVMSLTIEEKDKQLHDLKQDNAFLVARLEEAKNRLELNLSVIEDGYSSDVAKLHDQLARTHCVNIALVKELQNLEHFMENIVEHNGLDQSSFENLSDAPGSFSKLSKCLHHIRLLSTTLSENLSMCDGSRVFDIDEGSISLNAELLKSHLDSEDQGSPYLAVLQPNYQSCAVTDTKGDGGKNILARNESNINNLNSSRTGKRRTWSNPDQHPIHTPIFNSDGVSILEVSDDETVAKQSDVGIRPVNLVRGTYLHSNTEVSTLLPSRDLNDQNSLPRRRCWGDDTSNFSFIVKDQLAPVQPDQNEISLNRFGTNTNVGPTWYNSCLTSDSDIWSEPDRDVSLQRIGIDVKQSPVPKSPSHKSRSTKSKQTTDEISSEKSSVPHGCLKAQSWSRRRRNSGSTPKRLLMRKDSRLEKHLSLLKEECPRFVSLLHQFETSKEFRVEEPEVFADAFEVFKKLQCTMCETTQALVQLKDNGKNGPSSGCQKCLVNDLKQEIESSIQKLDSTNVIEKSVGTAAEEVLRRLISEVDNLNRQLGDTPDLHPSALRSLKFGSKQEQPMRGSIRKSIEIDTDPMRASQSSKGKVNLEFERRLSSDDPNELKKLINNLKWENDQLEARQISLGEEALFSKSLCYQLESDLKQTKDRLEEMVAKCLELEGKLVESSGVKEQFDQLLERCDEQKETISKLQDQVKEGTMRVRNLEQERDDLASENKQLDIINNQLNRKLSQETKHWTEKIESEKSKSEELLFQLRASTQSSDNLQIRLDEDSEKSKIQLSEKIKQWEEDRQSFIEAKNIAEDKCKNYEEEIVTLKTTIQEITEEINELRSEKIELLETQRKLKSINDQLDEKLSDKDTNTIQLNKLCEELETEKCKSEEELLHLRESSLTVFDLNKQLTEKLGQNELELEESNLKLHMVKSELNNLATEKDELINTNKSLEDKLSDAEVQLEKLKEDNIELIAKNKKLESIKNELNAILSNENNNLSELERLNKKLELDKNRSEEELVQMRSSTSFLQESNRELKVKLEEAIIELQRYNIKCKQQMDELSEYQKKANKLSLKCEELNLEVNKHSEVQEQLEHLKKINDELDELNRSLTEENKSLTEQLNDNMVKLEFKTGEMKNTIVELENQNRALKKENEHARGDLATTSSMTEQISNDLKCTQENLKLMETKCLSLEKELQDSLTNKNNYLQKIKDLEFKCNNFEKELRDSSTTKDIFIQKMQALKSKLVLNKNKLNNGQNMQSLSKVLTSKDIENKENKLFSIPSKSEFPNKDKQFEELCENIMLENDGLIDRIEGLIKKLSEYENALQQSRAAEGNYQQNLRSIQNKLLFQETELNELREQLQHSEKRIHSSEEERQYNFATILQNQVKILQDEVVNLKKQNEQAVLQRKASEERQLRIVASIENQLKIREVEIVDLKKQRDHALKQSQSFEKKYQRGFSQNEVEGLKQHKYSHVSKTDDLIADNEKSVTSLQSEIESLEQENHILQEQIAEERLHSKDKDAEILSLHEKVFNLQLQVNNLKSMGAKRSSAQLKHKSSMKTRDSKLHDAIESDAEVIGSTPSGHSRTRIGSGIEDYNSLHSDHSVSYSKPEGLRSIEKDSTMVPINLVDSSKIRESDGTVRGLPSFLTNSSYRQSNLRDSSSLKVSHPSITSVDTNLSSMSMDTDSLYSDPQKLKQHKSEADLNCERLMKETNILRERLAIAEDQVELLEKEKREIREHLSAQALEKKSILKAQVDDKLNFQLQLNKKDDFIKDLKNELCWTNNLLVDKQKEVINLERKISELERTVSVTKPVTLASSDSSQKVEKLNSKLVNEVTTLKNENFKLKTELMELQKFEMPQVSSESQKSQYSFLDSESSVTSPDAEKIKELSKLKWNLIKAIFALEKEFCQEKSLDLNILQSFMKHIETQWSLRFSRSLSKCISEPILTTTSISGSPALTQDVSKHNVLDFLEIDIECLQNIKTFLEKFVLPNAFSKKNVLEERRLKNELSAGLHKMTQLETYIKQLEKEKSTLHAENSKLRQLPSLQSYGSMEKFRVSKPRSTSQTFRRSEESAFDLTLKLSTVEDLLKSLNADLKITEISSQTEISKDDTPSESVKKSMLSKLVQETRELQKSAEKVFQLNSSIKAVCGLKDLEASKLSTAVKEFHFSDDTLTLSRSASISPLSFEDVCPTKGTPLRRSTKPENKPVDISNNRKYKEPQSLKLQNTEHIGSSQDSVCHRSHFSSPDLGIESDPNHESSAPEQAEKDFSFTMSKAPTSGKSEMEMKFKHSMAETQMRCPVAGAEKPRSAKDHTGAMGDSLCAISALQDYELLKQEIQESLVDIKSVISRTKDGLQHIAKYASPRKSLEHSTFKAIRDTCSNIEVYLSEAVKLVDGFRVAPYPSAEEWNSLNQTNQELNKTLSHLRWEMQKQQNEFHEAMKKLQHAQLVKDSMEKKISKKLVKTKKVLKLAQIQLQEPNYTMCHDCHTTLPTKDQAVDLVSHSSKEGH